MAMLMRERPTDLRFKKLDERRARDLHRAEFKSCDRRGHRANSATSEPWVQFGYGATVVCAGGRYASTIGSLAQRLTTRRPAGPTARGRDVPAAHAVGNPAGGIFRGAEMPRGGASRNLLIAHAVGNSGSLRMNCLAQGSRLRRRDPARQIQPAGGLSAGRPV